MDIETGQVLFEWSSLEHCPPDETALPLPLGQAGLGTNSSNAWDYFHINSITKGHDGHYLLSARHASTILKVNGTDCSVIWRLGGHYSDFELGEDVPFGFQHHARYRSESDANAVTEHISFFDNSVYGSESAGGGDKEVHPFPYSRGKHVRINHVNMTATLEKAFLPPDNNILAKSQGSLQTLPGGIVLINWGSEGQITEYAADGTPVFHAFLDGGSLQDKLQNYRAFRYNWTGFSPETPAIFAEETGDNETVVFVSWNGDTRTKAWSFTWKQETPSGVAVKTQMVKRGGFETQLTIRKHGSKIKAIFAEAVDERARILTTSDKIAPVRAYWLPLEAEAGDYRHSDAQQPLLSEL
jgi:hypothetical protein